MPKIIVDGKEIESRDKITVLQAVLDAGWDVPHYCYHPGLTVVASCRLCLMEMKMPNPKTKALEWQPRLFPSCQTPVKEGLEVRFDSDKVRDNQKHCMEYFLLNHPLDCPVCDKAGECYLQDYSREFGQPTSRMVEQKYKNPKKDIGPKTLLYADRCVMCSRCVRFCGEVAGTGELSIVNRGNRCEIDVFPGIPLDNKLQGNVVDLCPVGCLLDKDFLMEQRVWFLKQVDSICTGCSTGCTVHLDVNEGQLWRMRPRFNPGVNDWWICDEGRFGWKYVHDPKRLTRLSVRRGAETDYPDWSALPEIAKLRFESVVKKDGPEKVGGLLSPFMSCEEAWLLAKFLRDAAPGCMLAMGPVPVEGQDEAFPKNRNGNPPKFTIRAEKCPNRRGVEAVLAAVGGNVVKFEDFVKAATEKKLAAAWIVGGYPKEWVTDPLKKSLANISMIFAQDINPNAVTDAATVAIPSVSWAERSGSFMNHEGKIQPFDAGIAPLEGCHRDCNFLYAVAGFTGLYSAAKVREMMVKTMPQFGQLHIPPPMPAHAH